jgi:TPR repeat protein
MGIIRSLVSLATQAKQTAGSLQQLQGRAGQCHQAIHRLQDKLVQKDFDRAMAGNAQAQYEMGERFYQGLGVEKDAATAAAWFELAAKQGLPSAQRLLAMMYFLGRGVPPDPAEAYKWICLAAQKGGEEALAIQRKIAAKIPAEALAEGEKRAAAQLTL